MKRHITKTKEISLLTVMAVTSTLSASPFSGLMASYPLNGTALDVSGNDQHGLINGPTPTLDRCNRLNSAFLFSDPSQTIGLPPSLLGSSGGTISLWFQNFAQVTGNTGSGSLTFVIGTEDLGGGVARQISISIGDFTSVLNGEILGNLGGGGPPNPRSAVATSAIPSIPTGWHHVVLTSDATGHSFYLDGIGYTPTLFFDGLSAASNLWPLNGQTLTLGGVGSSDSKFKPFALDDVNIFDRSLNSSEVGILFRTRCVPDASNSALFLSLGLVALWLLRVQSSRRQSEESNSLTL